MENKNDKIVNKWGPIIENFGYNGSKLKEIGESTI